MTKIKTAILNYALHIGQTNKSIKTCDSWGVSWITESVYTVDDILSTSLMKENGTDVGDFSADM